jgi:hypothetical protein
VVKVIDIPKIPVYHEKNPDELYNTWLVKTLAMRSSGTSNCGKYDMDVNFQN